MQSKTRLLLLLVAVATAHGQLATTEPGDMQVELRIAKDSNRFRIGEAIPLELVLSSTTTNRYLEPCELFSERSFGFPQCRFFSRWSFSITPQEGWVDLAKNPVFRNGPILEVPNRVLTTQPARFSYLLTSRFRFDKPGEYHVRLTVQIGVNDETQRGNHSEVNAKPKAVNVTREIVLKITE
jgi:hypothetical protein